MTKRGETVEHPGASVATAGRTGAFGALSMVGAALLTVGAVLIDLGWMIDLPALGSLGNALSAAAGLGLLFLPLGLYASRRGGAGWLVSAATASSLIGICLASIVDVPAILDPTDLESGGALGPVGLVLLSAGFLAWFAAIRRTGDLGGWQQYIFLVAGLWFPLTFPIIQLPLFVIPNGRPSFILLAGVLGMLQFVMGMILREQAGDAGGFLRRAL